MSHGPSTLGTMTTDSRSPISVTSVVRSSRPHGLSSALTRVHRAVSPRSTSRPTRTRPARAASLFSTAIAASGWPRRMSARWARSGSLPTIFSLLGSKKWIIRDGVTGISSGGSGAPTARGWAKSRGLRIGGALAAPRARRARPAPPPSRRAGMTSARVAAAASPRPGAAAVARWQDRGMSTGTQRSVETDQAAREASGAHPYGRYLEEFEEGAVYRHWPAKTVTEADDHLFCLLTMNHHPLHINDVYAAESQQGRNVVVGPLVYSLALGMSVSDVSGKAIANLATEELSHPAPVFHGDTLFVESEVLEKRESQSKPDRGTVRVHTRVLNQDGVLVAEFKRLVLVPKRP